MSRRVDITARAWSAASPDTVRRLVADGSTWPTWSPIGGFHLEREGRQGGESAGAVRVFRTGTVRTREELLQPRPGEALAYTILTGLPIRAHRAAVTLTEQRNGTAIVWQETFEPTIGMTGPFLRWFLGRFVQRCVDGLATHAAASRPRRGVA